MRLKELREESKLTQKEVADAVGGTQSNLAKWEKEKIQPAADMVIKLADFFGVSTDYLLGRSDDFGNIILPTGSPTVPALSDDERQLLELYSRMTHQQKIRAVAYCEGLLSTSENASQSRHG